MLVRIGYRLEFESRKWYEWEHAIPMVRNCVLTILNTIISQSKAILFQFYFGVNGPSDQIDYLPVN